MSRSAKVAIGVGLALILGLGMWEVRHGRNQVFTSVVPPVRTNITPPQYAAQLDEDRPDTDPPGEVIRLGDHVRTIRDASGPGVWLDDGRYVLIRDTCPWEPERSVACEPNYATVLDPRTGRTSRVPGLGPLGWPEMPGEALHRVTFTGSRPTHDVPVDVLVTYRADLTAPRRFELPPYDGKNGAMNRNTGRRVFSIGDWDYVRYSDNDGEDSAESYGYLRRKVGEDRWHKALVNQRMVALWVSHDGRALLGLQQKHGEPCGGCMVAQQIVEIDPVKGTIARTYGVPKPYNKTWRVERIDKQDGRVLVRYVHRNNVTENLGVWQYNGAWKLVHGTDGRFTWWQGPNDRIEAITPSPAANEPVYFTLSWVHGTKRTPLSGKVAASEVASTAGIPGSLVRPE